MPAAALAHYGGQCFDGVSLLREGCRNAACRSPVAGDGSLRERGRDNRFNLYRRSPYRSGRPSPFWAIFGSSPAESAGPRAGGRLNRMVLRCMKMLVVRAIETPQGAACGRPGRTPTRRLRWEEIRPSERPIFHSSAEKSSGEKCRTVRQKPAQNCWRFVTIGLWLRNRCSGKPVFDCARLSVAVGCFSPIRRARPAPKAQLRWHFQSDESAASRVCASRYSIGRLWFARSTEAFDCEIGSAANPRQSLRHWEHESGYPCGVSVQYRSQPSSVREGGVARCVSRRSNHGKCSMPRR